ncbi:hypothetical protein KC19_1G024500 [Ceratodon purpureus]|uniref:Secreted protein n=1 Tax=Ceratodon purpureus TaxID=3225 RepID=A0A8T0J301_CERPU|nr:hypothetical protein KC19_1G024500 [Ceratodon purpureus]
MWFFLSIVVVLFHYFSTESRKVPSHSEGPFFSTNRCSSRSLSLIVSRLVAFPGIRRLTFTSFTIPWIY